MKKMVLFAVLALAFTPFAFADEAPAVETTDVTIEASAEAAPVITDISGELVLFADEDANFAAQVAAQWGCPFGAPSCYYDDQCDAYCGDPRFGVCSAFCCVCSG